MNSPGDQEQAARGLMLEPFAFDAPNVWEAIEQIHILVGRAVVGLPELYPVGVSIVCLGSRDILPVPITLAYTQPVSLADTLDHLADLTGMKVYYQADGITVAVNPLRRPGACKMFTGFQIPNLPPLCVDAVDVRLEVLREFPELGNNGGANKAFIRLLAETGNHPQWMMGVAELVCGIYPPQN